MSLHVYMLCPCCGNDVAAESYRNITHNLVPMAKEAGLYECLWRPDEYGFPNAEDLVEPLRKGLRFLRLQQDKCRALNPSNGWGTYEGLVRFCEELLAECRDHPSSVVRVSR